ncbi:arsenate reductase ArsC [Dictyobacter formicarum]|uniref:Protein-tyrosine-phosphatase n=1 Tax=Dictyobacter formicarum TaxID=2778368 RepID=A0ABQ3VDV3_9CHLR|nr:arsenate reductase ArsC [Dictyobacter formicarum]GHO84097.1 protein-tyrosine-phosphatase [Dictyobacter formicarum]
MKQRVLILCTGNSARSQMAEGWLRQLAGEQMDVESAGTAPSQVNPLAIQVMAERAIDISHHRSKHLNEFLAQSFDYVITVCDQAAEQCPVFPGKAIRIHWSIPDPAAAQGTHEERLAAFRQVRDDLERQLRSWVENLTTSGEA